ncbi:hypothetical protein ASPZODRAFT_133827 [Penicilliopsis zonata CBS 506.65]|uniref:Peptidase S9 prolyl oligopeptidase catalytic domain-containing protein n=1 Tax=Penicilliopsis zonata CBS 506.65 TaxID=1073090 RepID=A0A1L9SDN0_9EURO|nr:hypothetical protein ASPZODRAFT_133827 [Penicilliopsis zonata CBS 506.65]OJJ45194.1 hypothetical protein ASPZODRAFT_133827 [Penicilliopsis zonata CBS 506.65]
MFQLLPDESYHFELLRTLSAARYNGADVGEILEAADKLEIGNLESWYTAFYDLAQRVESQAQAIDSARHRISARDAWFRVATYYRTSEFYLHGNQSDPRLNEVWDKQAAAFDRALQLMDQPGQRVTIKTDHGFDVLGIFCPGAGDPTTPKPTIIAGTGYDGSMEEVIHHVGFGAIERGFNVITYEGPGQPTVLRQQNKGFIPDWEKVVTPIVDYLVQREEVDASRIALIGESMGGYLAVRAGAMEHRLAGVMAIDGVWDVYAAFTNILPPQLREFLDNGERDKMDQVVRHMLDQNSLPMKIRWGIEQGLWSFRTHSAYDWFQMVKPMALAGVIENVKCPVWVGEAANDIFFAEQPKKVADALGDKATFVVLTDADAAGNHCHVGAQSFLNQLIFDWFEDVTQ